MGHLSTNEPTLHGCWPLRTLTLAPPGRLLLILALAVSAHSQAATICVASGDVVGLKAAIATAQSNGEDDLIELQTGQYFLSSADTLSYYPDVEEHSLTIEGGYSDFFGNPCGIAPASPDARQSVIDGGRLRLSLPGGAGSISLKSVTISNAIGNNQYSVPVAIGGLSNSTGNVSIYNSMFLGNVSFTNEAVAVGVTQGTLLIQNSLFASNSSLAGVPPIRIHDPASGGAFCLGIVNSTFMQNASTAPAVRISTPACLALVANSVFWDGNVGGDMQIDSPSMTYMQNDDLGNLAEAANTQATNLLSVDPMFNSDYSLKDYSPLRDAGSNGGVIYSPGEFDVIGNPRTDGANPDIGAFEIQDVIFANTFD